jgi:uncharacterized SAM-binding protein YcdF (DUF218 family)
MKRAGRRRRFAEAVFVGIVVVCTLLAGAYGGTALVVDVPLAEPDAILVLGSHEWERLPAAAERARHSPSALLLLTQPRNPTIHNCHDCAHRADRLIADGVAASRIVMLPDLVSNTRDEAAAARAECERRGIRRLLIVTSPYHTRRAWRIFTGAFTGTPVTLGVASARDYSPARPGRWWKAAYDRAYVRYEWAAIVYDVVRSRRTKVS